MVDMAFGTIWEGIARELPDAVALREPDGDTSYAEFDRRAARLAAALRAHGVTAGSTVACYLYNGAAYLETVFAAFKLGAVPVNVNYRYRGAELTELLLDADAAALVYAGPLADAVRHASAEVPTLRLLVAVGAAPGAGGVPAMAYQEVQATYPPLPHEPRPGTDRLFMYTGGTTGRPKGVIWQQGDLLRTLTFATYRAMDQPAPQSPGEAVETAVRIHGTGQPRISLPVVPLMHGTGLFNTFGTLLTAGEVVFAGGTSLDPRRVWRAVARHRVNNMLIAGNAIARPLVDALVAAERAGEPHDLSSLRTIISSGTTFTDDLKAALHRRAALTIYDGLAASEGGPFAFAVTAAEGDLPSRFRPAPETLVVNAAGVPLAPGSREAGVLAFGGSLPLGYHKDPQRTAATYRTVNGVRHVIVGDYVSYDADGAVTFLGRGSGVINTGGEKVYPAEVEQALLTHPAVADVAVIGEPDDTWGERVAAVLTVHPGVPEPSTADLLEWVRPRLAGYKLPRRVVLVPELPRTPTGKLEVSRVRELLSAR
ncbi:MAG TPA: AMP-binding protein [Rugosimonospora sp.]|nr:AMP-binding protein [Rugosimonospora sp.]